ncbi:hypothetical protein ExPCM15_04347 [Escherichia coli]|nr:hypothetical protein ExPCM15_04347 [Escherichia coli]
MSFALGRFEQDPDNGKTNQRTARIPHKDFVAATQDTKVKHDVWQDGGDHRKAPDCETGLPVEPQNHTDCCKRDAGQPAQQAINAINHVERINGRPDGK